MEAHGAPGILHQRTDELKMVLVKQTSWAVSKVNLLGAESVIERDILHGAGKSCA